MGKTPRVVVYSQSNLSRDARVHRQLELLVEMGAAVSAFGMDRPRDLDIHFFDLSELIGFIETRTLRQIMLFAFRHGPLRTIARFLANVVCRTPLLFGARDWLELRIIRGRVHKILRAMKPDLIVANDISSLSICVSAKFNATLIYDAHEYSPLQHAGDNMRDAYADYLLRKYLPACDSIMTIGESIADLYKSRYSIQPKIVTNAPRYRELKPAFRSDGIIRLVHHGSAARQRRLETMIDVVKLLDGRFTLDFFLVARDPAYMDFLKARAAGDSRIRFNAPVPMARIPEELNRFDVGIRFYEPTTLNLQHGLPNKFFDFIQARLAVAVGPAPEARKYVERYGFGVVSEDYEPASMARALSALTADDIRRMKEKSDACAYELSAEPNREVMRELFSGRTPR